MFFKPKQSFVFYENGGHMENLCESLNEFAKYNLNKSKWDVSNIVQIESNSSSILVLNKQGCVYSRGPSSNNELGLRRENSKQWIILPIPTKIIQISLRYNHSLLLTENGYVYGCGNNKYFPLVHNQYIMTHFFRQTNVLNGQNNGHVYPFVR